MPLPPPPIGAFVKVASGQLNAAIEANAINQILVHVLTSTARTAMTLIALAEAVEANIPQVRQGLAKAHADIATEAQLAILETYDHHLKNTPDYRTDPNHARNRRYSGGILRGILADDNFVSSDADGIYLGDISALDSAARQWRRLNWGAGSDAGDAITEFTFRLSSSRGTFSEGGHPSPGFTLPAGRWIGGAFYPYSELTEVDEQQARSVAGGKDSAYRKTYGKPVPTRGIKGMHFMAAGIEVVADEIGRAYNNVFKDLWKATDAKGREVLAGSTDLLRPGTFSTDISGG